MVNAKPDLNTLKENMALTTRSRNRLVKEGLRDQNAKEMIGELFPGIEQFGFTKGQFSFINLIEAVLEQTGPADVVISTWTAAAADIHTAFGMLESDRIKSLRFIIDYSFKTRQPDFCHALRSIFGDDSIRVTNTHAKFTTIKNEKWNIVIRTSMNLNLNPRFENYEISDCAVLMEFMTKVVDEIWTKESAAEAFGDTPYQHKKRFKSLFDETSESVYGKLKDATELC